MRKPTRDDAAYAYSLDPDLGFSTAQREGPWLGRDLQSLAGRPPAVVYSELANKQEMQSVFTFTKVTECEVLWCEFRTPMII